MTVQLPVRECLGLLCLSFSILTFPAICTAQQNLLTNGSFDQWNEDGPEGWTTGIGANNGGSSPVSSVRRGDGPCLELSGDGSTMAWQFVTQAVAIEPGTAYRVSFSAMTRELSVEPGQFSNCYFGIIRKNADGSPVARDFLPLDSDRFVPGSLVFRAGEAASTVEVLIFLSHTGALCVRDVSVTALAPEDSFQILVDEMSRHYSFFEHKDIDWPRLTESFRERAEAAVNNRDEFIDIVGTMLAECKDLHIWIDDNGQRKSKYSSGFDANYNFDAVTADLDGIERFGRAGMTAVTSDGFGYIKSTALTGPPESYQTMAADIQRRLFNKPGIIVDLRRNGGGSEGYAQLIAGLFASEETTYALNTFRAGPQYDDFTTPSRRNIRPTGETAYDGPVVCLIGPGAVSSAEGFAMIMKALPGVTVIGQPTRGASGNPQPVQLPNGIDIWFSRWMSLMPDGTPIEDSGVEPDEFVEHGDGDPTYQRAVDILKERTR